MKKLLMFVLAATGLAACNVDEDPKVWVAKLAERKVDAERSMAANTLKFVDHVVIKEYFADVAAIAIALKQYSDEREKMVRRAGLGSIQTTCRDLLVSRESWERLMASCQYRGHFVCAEEARAYKYSVLLIAQSLSAESRANFENSSMCPHF